MHPGWDETPGVAKSLPSFSERFAAGKLQTSEEGVDNYYLVGFTTKKNLYQVPLKKENGQTIMVPLFHSQENISGKISIGPVPGKKVEHNGVKIELLGQIGFF